MREGPGPIKGIALVHAPTCTSPAVRCQVPVRYCSSRRAAPPEFCPQAHTALLAGRKHAGNQRGVHRARPPHPQLLNRAPAKPTPALACRPPANLEPAVSAQSSPPRSPGPEEKRGTGAGSASRGRQKSHLLPECSMPSMALTPRDKPDMGTAFCFHVQCSTRLILGLRTSSVSASALCSSLPQPPHPSPPVAPFWPADRSRCFQGASSSLPSLCLVALPAASGLPMPSYVQWLQSAQHSQKHLIPLGVCARTRSSTTCACRGNGGGVRDSPSCRRVM